MRARVGLLALALVALAGCGERGAAGASGVEWPPGSAGVACNLLDYGSVEAALGTRFDTAGGATQGTTHTCALTATGHEYPDLTLSYSATQADEVVFQATVMPAGASPLDGLGRTAYQLSLPAGDGHGPAIEVGWLSPKGRLVVLRYTMPADATPDQAEALAPKVVNLATSIG